ncbi:hypothetical protein ACHAWF_017892 [Thalassiosira exigua]
MNQSKMSRIHHFTELGMQALFFLNLAINNCKSVGEYLLAASAFGKDSRKIMIEALEYLNQHIGSWVQGSNDGSNVILMVLSILTALPDDRQEERIATLLANEDREDRRCGLMVMGDLLLREYPNHYQARAQADRYIEYIRMLQKQRAVSSWISRNQNYCAWMEPESRPESAHPMQQSRSDHSGRRGGGHHNPNAGNFGDSNAVDDSDLDDDDSRSDEDDDYSMRVREMVVEGCGVSEINGIYKRSGHYDDVPKYSRTTRYNGRDEEFSLFRCKLTDNTRRWYISIVPLGSHPGTTKDIDFYAAVPNANGTDGQGPPRDNWMCIPNSDGAMPPPVVYPRPYYDDGNNGNQNQGSNSVVDQDQSGYL